MSEPFDWDAARAWLISQRPDLARKEAEYTVDSVLEMIAVRNIQRASKGLPQLTFEEHRAANIRDWSVRGARQAEPIDHVPTDRDYEAALREVLPRIELIKKSLSELRMLICSEGFEDLAHAFDRRVEAAEDRALFSIAHAAWFLQIAEDELRSRFRTALKRKAPESGGEGHES